MKEEEYKGLFEKFVRGKLSDFYEGLKPFYSERGKTDDSLSYFRNHFPRFWSMIEMISENTLKPLKICELGSWYPYTSYYFKLRDPSVHIDLYDIITKIEKHLKPYNVDRIKLHEINFNKEKLPDTQYDVIILSEVMEHLPINLFKFEQGVIRMMRNNGYLVVTYPMHGLNAKDYDKDLEGYDLNGLGEPHLREFTEDTVKLFFNDLQQISMCDINYPAYGNIKIIMYKKVEV